MQINGGDKHGSDSATFQVLKPLCSNCFWRDLREMLGLRMRISTCQIPGPFATRKSASETSKRGCAKAKVVSRKNRIRPAYVHQAPSFSRIGIGPHDRSSLVTSTIPLIPPTDISFRTRFTLCSALLVRRHHTTSLTHIRRCMPITTEFHTPRTRLYGPPLVSLQFHYSSTTMTIRRFPPLRHHPSSLSTRLALAISHASAVTAPANSNAQLRIRSPTLLTLCSPILPLSKALRILSSSPHRLDHASTCLWPSLP